MARSRKKIGEILVAMDACSKDQVEKVAASSKSTGKRLGEALIEAGVVNEGQVAKALANQYGWEFVDLGSPGVAERIDHKLIDPDLIKKHQILPLSRKNGRMELLVHDPVNIELLDLLRFRLNVEIDPKIAQRSQIKAFIDNKLNAAKSFTAGDTLVSESIDRTIDRSVDRSLDKSIDITGEDAPMVRLVTRILTEAVNMRASDIHIEPMADRVRLRYRIDGVCIERDNLPKRMQNAVLSRVKLMSGMNIAEKRTPQDGRIKLPTGDTSVDFRVSACPAYHGESVVLRILRSESAKIGMANLGFEQDQLDLFNRIIRRPNGIFLVTGPTGSGKTTTLYSALSDLNRPDKKIITAEDPIEYNFDGINQCQVNEKIGLGFSTILRTMLRQAPNIILVGEIRDREVAEIAIQAALTGHLVFSTLHTNDAPSAITRLIDMGVKPFLVASAIQAIMAQRLVRVLCKHCKQLDPNPDPKHMKLVGLTPQEAAGKVYKPVGCPECAGIGYRGRQAVFEIMLMTSQIREQAFNLAPLAKIRETAVNSGMKTLVQDGKAKILKGITTPDEVAKIAQVAEIDLDE